MPTRTYRIAPSLARLAARGAVAATRHEGYLGPDARSGASVSLCAEGGRLHVPDHDAAVVPEPHAKALLDAAERSLEMTRSHLNEAAVPTRIDRYRKLGLDLVTFTFEDAGSADLFEAPRWVEAEVTNDHAYTGRSLAWDGVPATPPATPTEAGLSELLDVLDEAPQARAA